MADSNYSSTSIIAVVIAAGVALAVPVVNHILSRRRESAARLAAACTAFRKDIETAASVVPPASQGWGNEVVAALPTVCKSVETAAKTFSPFLPKDQRRKFLAAHKVFKLHCTEAIPKALSNAEIMYGGGASGAKAARQRFYSHLNGLLSYAQEI